MTLRPICRRLDFSSIGVKLHLALLKNAPLNPYLRIISLLKYTPLLSGFVCAFHPAALGSNPKHTIYVFINLNLNCNCNLLKRRK